MLIGAHCTSVCLTRAEPLVYGLRPVRRLPTSR